MLYIKTFICNPYQENTYIVYNDQKEACIIDPGMKTEQEKNQFASFIQQEEIQIKQIINTHCHIDHVYGLNWIIATYHISTLFIHTEEEKILSFSYKMMEATIPQILQLSFLNEGDIVHVGEEPLLVLYTPGHSPGSISFYNKNNKIVFSGDTLFNGSIGRTDLPFGNHAQLINNIKEKLFTLPPETKVLAGHMNYTTIEKEIRDNMFFH